VKEQALKRFDHEAKMLQALDSDHIVKLRDHFFEDHRGYLVLEHINGKTLRQLVDEKGALSEAEILSMSQQMCLILAHLHERDIIHRDFTPDNLILTEDGTLKLIDFNVAQSTAVGTTGTIAGKHAYLPPEQFRGKATKQSDIYAMGATLFYLAVGHDPEPISQSSALKSGATVSASLDELMRGCTAIDCAKRFGSIADVETGLRLCQAGDGAALTDAMSKIELATIDLRSPEKQPARERDVTHG
jgi:serine/threonine protein kinase